MSKFKFFLLASLILLFFTGCKTNNRTNILSGPYLGAVPPENIPLLFAPGIVSGGEHDMSITMTPDLKKIYWSRSGFDWFSTILMIEEVNGIWSSPKLANYGAQPKDNYPYISANGKYFVYDSYLPYPETHENNGSKNIWLSNKVNEGWSQPVPLDIVNTPRAEAYPAIANNGNIYFYSQREDSYGGIDLYICEKTENGYKPAKNLGRNINSKYHEFHQYIAPDESYILFDSIRPDGFGANDLYISFKLEDGTWSKATNMGNMINTEYSEMRPYISPDNLYLFFCSNRPGEATDDFSSYDSFMNRIKNAGNGSQDIYWISSNFIMDLKKIVADKQSK